MRDIAFLILFVCFLILGWHDVGVCKENKQLKKNLNYADSINTLNKEFFKKNFKDTAWWYGLVNE